jgi:hypothetical protein
MSMAIAMHKGKSPWLSGGVTDLERISTSFDTDIQFSFEEDLSEDQTEEELPFLFDVAWEVCRKVGGIYTVSTEDVDEVGEEEEEEENEEDEEEEL